jgi:ATP-dependent helicase/nuclease subunit B
VVSPPANVRRCFLPWDRPLLPQAAKWLASNWGGAGPLDLSRILVVVPTRQSGRRLREALAAEASTKQQAVFPPRVITTETLLSLPNTENVASRLESLLSWVEVLATIDLASFRQVFPIDPPARNFAWAFRLAQTFSRLQATLAEVGLRFENVRGKIGPDAPEAERWQELGKLERLYVRELVRHGLRDSQEIRIEAAINGASLPGIEKIVLLAAADPLPVALEYLAIQARGLPVEVVVFAPPAEADAFDGWGRPLIDAWNERELLLPHFAERVHLCADPSAQAEQVATLAQAYPDPDGLLGVGVVDPEVAPPLITALARAGVPSFNPEGRSRRRGALFHLLTSLAALAHEPSFAAVEQIARCPEFLSLLGVRFGENFSAAAWLAGLDQLRSQHLPSDLGSAQRYATEGTSVAAGLLLAAELHACLTEGKFPAAAAKALGLLFSARRLDLTRDEDAEFAEAARQWTELVRECAAAASRFDRLTHAEWWELALRLFGEARTTDDKPAGVLELQGWLELLWEDAPHLVVAGLNDGRVPEAVVGDPFLPEALRERLGLKTNARRFARDAYIFQAVNACRPRADWLFGKTSTVGDPLRPSRLLLRCADADLPERVEFLFRTPDFGRPTLAWQRAWRLRPRLVAPPSRIRVTALRDYLRCPFRFYLRHVLRMEAVDPEKSELDAFDFGTLCHAALEQIGRQPDLRDCTDAATLREALWREFDGAVRARFGWKLTLPLVIQCEAARQRLAKAAEIQVRERAAGWVIQAVEQPFAMELSGLAVNGKIDRIERHAQTGAWRVLDYKTTDTAHSPVTAHLGRLRADEAAPEWALVTLDDKPRVWADLQLPLYLEALQREFPGEWTAGYFNLPKAVGETGVALWDDYSGELRAAALRCAAGACQAIRAGKFWPPNEAVSADRDEFAALFHHGVAESIAWEVRT